MGDELKEKPRKRLTAEDVAKLLDSLDSIAKAMSGSNLISGEEIRISKQLDLNNNKKTDIDFRTDPRFTVLIEFASQIKDTATPLNFDTNKLPSISLFEREQAIVNTCHQKMIEVIGCYDEVMIAAGRQQKLELDEIINHLGLSPQDFVRISAPGFLNPVSPSDLSLQDKYIKYQKASLSLDIKYHIIRERLATKEELDGKTFTIEDLNIYKKRASENLGVTISTGKDDEEKSERFGKGSLDPLARGAICRHFAPIMSAMLDAAGVKSYVFRCTNLGDEGGHVVVFLPSTGNLVDPSESKDPYLINLKGNMVDITKGGNIFYLKQSGDIGAYSTYDTFFAPLPIPAKTSLDNMNAAINYEGRPQDIYQKRLLSDQNGYDRIIPESVYKKTDNKKSLAPTELETYKNTNEPAKIK